MKSSTKKEMIIVSDKICWLNFMIQKFQNEYSVKPLYWHEWENLPEYQRSMSESCILDRPQSI